MKWVWALLLIIFVSLQVRLWVGEGSLAQVTALNEKIRLQKVAIRQLQKRNKKLLYEIQDLREGTAGIEEKARFDMGMIKDDETFFLYLPEES